MKRCLQGLWFLGLAIAHSGIAVASPDRPDFYQDVLPFLQSNCIVCHNKTTSKARLNMETPALMIKGGDSGSALVPGNSGDSLVVTASVHSNDLEMPPANNKSGASNLSPEEIAILKRWIDQGAKASAPQESRKVAWRPLAPGVDPIYSVALTGDGRFAACGRSNRIFLYDLAALQFVGEIGESGVAHRAMVQSLAFSPDGTRLASGSFRELKIWKLEPSAIAATPHESAKPADEAIIKKIVEVGKVAVLVHAVSTDGSRVITGGSDGSVRVWDLATAKPVTELRGSLALSRELAGLEWMVAREALEQAFQKGEVARIEAQNKALDELLKKANDAIVAMKQALPEKQKAVKPTQDEKAVQQKVIEEILSQIAKAPEGKPDPALEKQLRDAQEKLAPLTKNEISALAAVSAAESNIKDAEADLLRINELKAENSVALDFAIASIEVAKKSQDKAASDLATARQALAKPATTKPVLVALSRDGRHAAALFEDGRLTEWTVGTGTPVAETKGMAGAALTLGASPGGGFVATGPEGISLSTPGVSSWKLERTLGGEADPDRFSDRINAVKFSPDGKQLAVGGGEPSRSGDLTLFDVATGKQTAVWKDQHDDTVMSLDFSPDGKLLASGGADKIVRVMDLASGRLVNLLEGHTHYVMGVAFRADGRVLASAGADGVVISWNMILGELKKKIEGWTKEVTSVQFIGATNQIVTSAGDNRVRIVNDDGGQIRDIAGLPDFVQAAATTLNGATLIGGGEDSTLRVWNGTDGKEIAAFSSH